MVVRNEFHDGRVVLYGGDCLEVLDSLPENSIDSIVTDPPYHLASIIKRFGKPGSAPAQFGTDGAYARVSSGFMGKEWDGGDIAFRPETWAKALRVLKPGGYILAFGASRNFHRMAVAIEDAGFEIRDTVMWLYGTGFPKSHNIEKAINKIDGVEFDKEEASGVGFMGPDGPGGYNVTKHHLKQKGESSERATHYKGWGTALKPAYEPIIMGRKSLSEKSIAENVLLHGTGGINIDGCRIGVEERTYDLKGGENLNKIARPNGNDTDEAKGIGSYGVGAKQISIGNKTVVGRFPANVVHDGSDEVMNAFPGSESRFFYSAKANKKDRAGSGHPTIKPIDLMRYLVRLVTPKDGIVLDMFAGSGTTGEAAFMEGFNSILIEREEEYQKDIAKRMGQIKATKEKPKATKKAKPQSNNTIDRLFT